MGASHVVAACALVLACACGTGDTRIDPGDLELRDLLGVAPETAGHWDVEQRESARRVITDALADSGEEIAISIGNGTTLDEQVARSLATLDAQRLADGDSALGFVRVTIAGNVLVGATRDAPSVRAFAERKQGAPAIDLELTDIWQALPQASHELLATLASDAGAPLGERVVVVPAPRLSVIASYVAGSPSRLLVNPVLLAAIDPQAQTLTEVVAPGASPSSAGGRAEIKPTERVPGVLAAGNPYSFYGSVAECAAAQRSRCTACVAANDCVPVTSTDGVEECNALAEANGYGYFLICVNLALAISSVEDCTAELRPGCARDTNAASDLDQLQNNVVFLDDPSCGVGLDACLAKIYGEPEGDFPQPGSGTDPDPPRETNVTCNESCDSGKNSNCEFSPNCNCEGPSCGNSLSCDSTCSSSNNQSGCNDNCDSCSSDGDSTGSTGGGSCSGDSGSSGTSGDCGGDGGCSGGGCGGGDSGGGCSGGDSGGGCSGGGGGGGCSGGGGGGGGCQVTKKPPSAVFAMALSLSWALLPVPLAAMLRRRSKRRRKAAEANREFTDEEVKS